MAEYKFGSGIIAATRTDVVTGTPTILGALQDVSIDYSFTNKQLMGQNQFPLDVARGGGKIQGKAKFGQIRGQVFNDFFFGETMTTGQNLFAYNEAASVPGISTFVITVANSAHFLADEGVLYAATLFPLTKVASGPTLGQYSVSAGVYTFAAADANAAMLLSYTYTATTGFTIPINNELMGFAPNFSVQLSQKYKTQTMIMRLNKCISSKLSFATKNEDYTIPEFDFEVMDDGTGHIGSITTSE